MKDLKRILPVALMVVTFLLTACGSGDLSDKYNKKVVCTSFAAYDWTRNIIGDVEGFDIIYLTKSGVDLHSFTPTTRDLVDISTADLVIYIGGPSDMWVLDATKNKVNPRQQVLALMDILSDKVVEEELVEGMTEEEEEEEEEIEYDEHVWLSLENAMLSSDRICSALSEIDSENAASLASNNERYQNELASLRESYLTKVAAKEKNTILVCDRFPFRYMFDELSLEYYAAFPGCSAESEAVFDTIVFLSNKIDELGLSSICVLEGSNQEISRVVIDNANTKNVEVLTLNSLQSISQTDIEDGVSYLSLMEENLDTILKLLD